MLSKTTLATSLLAAVAQVSALGSAVIKNECSSDVYLWTVSNVAGEMTTIPSGKTYTEGYQMNPTGGGISMKLAMEPDLSGSITQFEYTIAGNLWYDISNINGFPFMKSGLTLIPSISSCRSMVCPAGVALCSAAYNQPDDNEATAACDSSADTTLVLCSGQEGTTPVASASEIASAPATTLKQANVVNVPATTAAPATTTAAPAAAATTAAPVVVEAQAQGGNVFTTFVTQVFTVYADEAPAATGTPEVLVAEKRGESHAHKRAAHRHHFNRHVDVSN